MAEVKTLSDYWNPMQTGMQMLQLDQNAQALELRKQSEMAQQQHQQRLEQLNALSTTMGQAPLSDQYPILKQYAEVAGIPLRLLPSQNAFISNPDLYQKFVMAKPGSQEQQQYGAELKKMSPSALKESAALAAPGMKLDAGKALRGAAGSTEENRALDMAVSEFGPAQTQASQVAFQTPMEKAKAEAIINQGAMVKVEGEYILGAKNAARAQLEEARPLLDAYEQYSATINQNERSKIMQKFETIPGMPDFDEKRLAQIPQVKKELEHFRGVRQEIATNLERLSLGLPMTGEFQGKTPEVVDAQSRALNSVIELNETRLEFLKNPNKETFARYANLQQRLEDRATSLRQTHMNIEQLQLADKQGKEAREIAEKQLLATAQTEFAQRAAKLGPSPSDSALMGLAGEIAAKHPGVAPQQLIINLHNKAGVEIKMPGTTEEAGKFTMINNALQNVQDVKRSIIKKDGSVDRDLVFQSFTNMPFSEGRDINSMIEDAIAAKLRAETGAAANADEVKSMARRFGLNSFDKDSVIVSKLNRLERFLSNTLSTRDPSGKIRASAGGGTVGTPQPGTVQGGYRFKGGDPAKASNWEKVN
jgi:hypothetical protein